MNITNQPFLKLGNQSRPRIFDLAIHKPEVLYQKVVEVDERVTLEDYAEDPEQQITEVSGDADENADLVKGMSGEAVRILKRLDEDAVRKDLQAVYDEGFKSIAVCLMHSYTYPKHELAIGRLAEEVGFSHISLSAELMPMIKYVPRATSATADAYLTPEIKKYLSGFEAGFEGGLGSESASDGNKGARCEFMQSDGGLVDVKSFSGLRAILSGPAGGVVGYALTSYDHDVGIPVIGFDMVSLRIKGIRGCCYLTASRAVQAQTSLDMGRADTNMYLRPQRQGSRFSHRNSISIQ